MYRKHLSQKASPSVRSTPINQEIAKSPSYGSLSGVVQRVQQDPNSVSEDERQQLESAIGSRSTGEILAGKQTPWVPEFQGISAQIWGNSGEAVAPIQAKLTIGEVGDKYEQEADRVAKDVVQQIHAPQTNPPTTLQHQQLPEIVQRREAITGAEASTDLDTAINTARGSGQPLDVGLQNSMGQAMGADFSGVRVHTDAQADKLNRSIQAKAFTTGQDVFFRQGEYQPGSQGGQELIAHELTHVVQQNDGAVQSVVQRVFSMDDDDWLEQQQPIDISKLLDQKLVTEAEATKEMSPRPSGLTKRSQRNAWDKEKNKKMQSLAKQQQFKSDTALWYHTLFDTDDQLSETQQKVLKEQQQLLKRHFISMAALGVQSGDQNTGVFTDYKDEDVPLAALASHGGRFAYEAERKEVGDEFFNQLMTGSKDELKTEGPRGKIFTGSASRSLNPQEQSLAHAGLYQRRSTHPQSYDARTKRWKEKKKRLGEMTGRSLGMNMAFGGIRNKTGEHTTVGPEGAIINNEDGVNTVGQHGHAFFKYDSSDNAGGRLMVGFEGSGPGLPSLLGEHGATSAISGNERSLTGQSKAAALDLPTAKMGGVKAVVTKETLDTLKTLFSAMESQQDQETERKVFKQLLASTNKEEREAALQLLLKNKKEEV